MWHKGLQWIRASFHRTGTFKFQILALAECTVCALSLWGKECYWKHKTAFLNFNGTKKVVWDSWLEKDKIALNSI